MMSPRVTVLMPVRNGERYLAAAVAGITSQSFEDFDFVIVDDGSTDATPSLLKEASSRDPRIRVLTRASTGIVGALEAGRAVSRAPYIARMDADDVALPHRLALQVAYLDSHRSAVAVGGQVRDINEHGADLSRGRFPLSPSDCRAYLAYGAPFCHPAVMLRREALDAVGGYRRLFEPAEDLDLWLRLAMVGDLANLDQEVLKYRRHAATVTARRAVANARAACLARLTRAHGDTVLPPGWRTLHTGDAEWRTIEAALPTHVRLEARATYLQALTLNGGITEPKAWAQLTNALPELAAWSRTQGQTEKLAFMMVRAAYQVARSGQPSRALLTIWLGLRCAPIAVLREAASSVRARLATRHRPRAAGSDDQQPGSAPPPASEIGR
ncbi:MAG: glycosyltransferase family 2 protein [Hyphomicrobiaceae bacterium]